MAENKADRALRKVIINLVPYNKFGGPVMKNEYLQIDISDKLKSTLYYLDNIKINNGEYEQTITYVTSEDYRQFKRDVENILDATIVNTKQRESIQRLLDAAFYDRKNFDGAM